jgi:hypothetical protein
MNIHTFGQVIPYNPDNLPEQGLVTGPGTERPVGFIDFDLMARLYWSVKSFRVSAIGIPLLNFTFEAFLLGGGVTGTILGSVIGLATAAQTSPVPLALTGETELMHIFTKKVRRVRDGVYRNITQEESFKPSSKESSSSSSSSSSGTKAKSALDIDPDINPNYLVSKYFKPKEGIFVSPGGYHSLITNYGGILINFSDVIYAKRQYWPKVFIFLRNPQSRNIFKSALAIRDPFFSAALQVVNDRTAYRDLTTDVLSTPTVGGVSFLGQLVPLYGTGNVNIFSIFGAVSIGNRVCDRFYFDGAPDSTRKGYNEDLCKSVYRKE